MERAIAFWYLSVDKSPYGTMFARAPQRRQIVSYTSKVPAAAAGTQHFRMTHSRIFHLPLMPWASPFNSSGLLAPDL